MEITFLIEGQRHYDPGVKPFRDLAQGAQELSIGFHVVLFQVSDKVVADVQRRFDAKSVVICNDLQSLATHCRAHKEDVLFGSDWIETLVRLHYVARKTGIRIASYLLSFRGLSTLGPYTPTLSTTLSFRVRSGLSRWVPFPLVRSRYVRLLKSFNAVVACSNYAEMVAHTLYGIHPQCRIYPPVVQRPFHSSGSSTVSRQKDGVFVFLGSEHDRAPVEYLPTLRTLVEGGKRLTLVGRRTLVQYTARQLGTAPLVESHWDLSDRDFAELLLTSQVTYLPQRWEGFGYLGPESLLVGTPVVCENPFPWMEITGESEHVRICRTRGTLTEALLNPASASPLETSRLTRTIGHQLSARTQASALVDGLSSTLQ